MGFAVVHPLEAIILGVTQKADGTDGVTLVAAEDADQGADTYMTCALGERDRGKERESKGVEGGDVSTRFYG
jgi:hypothetical protein